MIDLKQDFLGKPSLIRGIPGTRYYLELYPHGYVIKVRGSRLKGVHIGYLEPAAKMLPPPDSPAKLKNAAEYLDWVAAKVERRKEKAHDRRAANHDS